MTSTIFLIVVIVGVIGILKLSYFVWLAARYPEPLTADEVHTVVTEDTWPIRLYRHLSKTGGGEPVFLCHALATNHLNYELPEGHSLVDALMEAGYDCWTIDLRGDRNCPPPKGMSRRNVHVEDYLTKDIPAALQYIREKTGYEQVHWVGHSMGGMLFYAYQATFGGEHIASATTFGAPLGFKDTKVKSGIVIAWLANVCPPLLSGLIRGATPLAPILKPQVPGLPINWDNMHPDLGIQAYYNLLEAPPGGVAYDMNRWAVTREWKMNGETLDVAAELRKGDTPLLAFFAKDDPFVNLADAEDFMDNLPTGDKAIVILSKEEGCEADYNHCDIPFSSNADVEVFVHVIDWLQEHPIGAAPAAPKRSSRVETAAKLAADALGWDTPPSAARKAEAREAEPAKPKAAAKKPRKKKAAAKSKAKAPAKKKAAKSKSKAPVKKKSAAKSKTKPKAVKKKSSTKRSSAKAKSGTKKKSATEPKAKKKASD